MRTFLIISFLILIIASLVVAGTSLYQEKWEALTASFSLTIGIISAWVAYEGFHKQYLHSRAQIVLMPDVKSRAGLIQLVIKNSGQSPAFNIKIIWNDRLINLKNEPVAFNRLSDDVDIAVLNPSESASAIVDSIGEFLKKNKEKNLDFSGKINFQESLSSKKTTTQPFQFSFRHLGVSLLHEEEGVKTMVELQKIPDILKAISKELAGIKNNLNTDDEEKGGTSF